MITNFFTPELNNHDVQELWFQHDGATCHTARATIDLLKDTFGDRLISRFGPVNWPARSCDLTPLDYFLWGYVKSLVYADKPQTLDHLEDNTLRVIADIRPQMLEKVIESWTSRLDYIRATNGSHMPVIIFKITIRNYLVWILVHRNIRYFPKPFVDATDELQLILTGSKTENDWEICILSVDKAVGFALGSMFVRKAFPGASKPMAVEMIHEIKEAFKENFPWLEWMDSETRELVVEKVNSIKEMIGFPEYIKDFETLDEKYQELEFNETQYFENHLNFLRHDRLNNFKKLRQPPNQDTWLMTPSTVNAYYSAPSNTIVFPAAILQPPLYDLTYPKFVNFGSVGVVMGHELTHAFDVQGRLYDKYGNLHQWWKNSSILNFRLRAKCFLDQYSTYEMNGVKVNGKLTLGENIADSGGLKAAFRAYRNWVKKNHAELPLPGIPLSTNQLFFVAFAQTWCSVKTPELQRFASLTDPHSPNKYRVIGTLSNSIDFNWEFKCPSESTMNAEIKCEAWR
ncbi:endothelin-converting enzyme homolog [Trichonephila clavipes]|nr:endothelin-converting enzyme homolog [Trichonephila clavipes]